MEVLRQSSRVRDLGENSESSKCILRNIEVHSRAIIDYQFRASMPGYVGCIFKYKDDSNFYSFEVGGGDDITKRFFQLRKKVNGTYSVIKRINTDKDIPSVPFFGYELATWYAVQIIIKDNEIAVYVALLGTTSKLLLFKVDDNSLPWGMVGFSTFNTEAAFDEIFVRPIPLPHCKLFF